MMRRNQKGGALAVVGIGCLVLIILAVVAGYVVYQKGVSLVREGVATMVRTGSEEAIKQLKFPKAEREAIMKPVHAFADDIKAGKVDFDQGTSVVKNLTTGPVMGMIVSKGIEYKYLKGVELADDEVKKAKVTISRFCQGLLEEKIDVGKFEDVKDIFSKTTTVTNADGTTHKKVEYKDTITKEELNKCLKMMAEAADEAKLANKEFKVDIAKEVKKVIDDGMKAGGK